MRADRTWLADDAWGLLIHVRNGWVRFAVLVYRSLCR